MPRAISTEFEKIPVLEIPEPKKDPITTYVLPAAPNPQYFYGPAWLEVSPYLGVITGVKKKGLFSGFWESK